MTTCDAERLSRFLDGDLGTDEYREIASHLRTCSRCREELAALRHVDEVVWTWGAHREPIPLKTEARLLRSLQRRRRPHRLLSVSRMMPAALGTSVAALLVLVSTNLSPFYRENSRPVPESARVIASQSLKEQSAPLVYARGKSAVSSSETGNYPQAPIDRHPQLDIY